MTQIANLLIAQDLSLSFSLSPLTGREHSILPKHNPLPLCPLLHRGSGRTCQHGPHRVQGEVTPHHSPLVDCVHVGQCRHVGSTVHHMAVPCRNRRLFHRVFWSHRCVQSAVSLNSHQGRYSYSLHRLIRYSCIYKACMSPNRSSALRRFKHSDAIKIRNRIFSTRDCHT